MSEESTTPPQGENVEQASVEQEVPEVEQPSEAGGEVEGATGNREAAKYRRRLREIESERDQLREQVAGFQRGEAERLLGEDLEQPSDIWMTGAEINTLLDEDGQVDHSKVQKLAKQVLADHPSWVRKPRITPDYEQGRRSDADEAATWSGLMRNSRVER